MSERPRSFTHRDGASVLTGALLVLVGCSRGGDAVPASDKSAVPAVAPAVAPAPAPAKTTPALPPCSSLAFVSERDGNPEIYTLSLADGALIRRTKDPAGDFATPIIEPVIQTAAGPTPALVMIRADERDGSHRERLALLPLDAEVRQPPYFLGAAGRIRNPSAPARGGWIVYESDLNSFRDLYRLDLRDAAATPTRLTDNKQGNFEPAVSADGQRIAFVSSRDGDAELYVMQADGSEQRRLTEHRGDDSAPRWSPDGSALAFTRAEGGSERAFILAMRGASASGEPRPLRRVAPVDRGLDRDLAWSADGTKLALTEAKPGRGEVVVFEVATGEELRRSGAKKIDEQPAWAPEGSWLAFVSDREGDAELFRLHVETGEIARLTNAPGPDWLPRWYSNDCDPARASHG